MKKEEIVQICEACNFTFDYDRWDDQGYLRFVLNEELDEPDLRLIWYKEDPSETNLNRMSQILFQAGQKAHIQRITKYGIKLHK